MRLILLSAAILYLFNGCTTKQIVYVPVPCPKIQDIDLDALGVSDTNYTIPDINYTIRMEYDGLL